MKKVSNFLNNIISQEGGGPKGQDSLVLVKIQKDWEKIAGATVAAHSLPIKVYSRSLILLTDSPHFSQQISFMTPMILDKIFSLYPKCRKLFNTFRFQCNPELFSNMQINYKEIVAKPKKKLNPDSPAYKRLQLKANELLFDINDHELKNILIELYISTNYPNDD